MPRHIRVVPSLVTEARHFDRRVDEVDQMPKDSCAPMGSDRSPREASRKQALFPRARRASEPVDAVVDDLPCPASQPVCDRARRVVGGKRLSAREEPVLYGGMLGKRCATDRFGRSTSARNAHQTRGPGLGDAYRDRVLLE